MYYYISIHDMPFLDIREIIVPDIGHTIIINFFHRKFEKKLAFSVFLKLHFTDGPEIYTDIQIEESENMVVGKVVIRRIQERLNSIFAPYFLSLTGSNRYVGV